MPHPKQPQACHSNARQRARCLTRSSRTLRPAGRGSQPQRCRVRGQYRSLLVQRANPEGQAPPRPPPALPRPSPWPALPRTQPPAPLLWCNLQHRRRPPLQPTAQHTSYPQCRTGKDMRRSKREGCSLSTLLCTHLHLAPLARCLASTCPRHHWWAQPRVAAPATVMAPGGRRVDGAGPPTSHPVLPGQ